jgi:hypothetical protein
MIDMKKGFLLVCLSLFSLMAFSQTSVVEFLKGGKADANKLIQAYLEPYAFALGDGLNNGWYNSAKTHKLFGFDLTVSVSAIQIPEQSKTFDINGLKLTNMEVVIGSSIAPTVAGKDSPGPAITVFDSQRNKIVEFNSPSGSGLDMVPVPMAQVGFGLLPHTDVIGRYVPEMKYDNNGDEMKLGFWGVGVKHNFMEWMPVLKELPFDASLFGSYSEVNAQSALSFTSDNYSSDPNITVEPINTDDQFLKVKTKTSKFGLVVSKKISILTVFGGIGKSTSKSNVDLIGTYPVVVKAQNGGYEITEKGALIDPVALSFETSNLSLDIGIRLKIAFFSLFGSVNKSEYTSYNAGVSLGMR